MCRQSGVLTCHFSTLDQASSIPMDNSFFCPPKSFSLNNEVIGDVMQRGRLHYTNVNSRVKCNRVLVDSNFETTNELPQSTRSFLGKRVRPSETNLTKLELERKERRREQCRVNQAHYRNRRRKMIVSLQLNNQLLVKEIQELELHHHSYFLGVPAKQTPWTFATRYFTLFRESVLRSREFDALALRSLQASTTSDVTDGFVIGPEALLENVKLFSRYFSNFQVALEELKKGPTTDSIIAITTTSVTISEDTLRLVFPHLNEVGQQSLGSKLLNQEFVMRGLVQFDWDDATNRVVGIYSRSDMLTPILRTLGSLNDVSRVFDGALVTPEGRLLPSSK